MTTMQADVPARSIDEIAHFDREIVSVADFAVEGRDEKTNRVNRLRIGNALAVPSDRFWNSLATGFSSLGVNNKLYRLFDHEEVFQRIVERAGRDAEIGVTIETRKDGSRRLLSIGKAGAGSINGHDLTGELTGRTEKLAYHEGVVKSTHRPAFVGEQSIGGDAYHPQFVVTTPIDGYGKPTATLALLRLVCENGSVAMAPIFSSALGVPRDGTSSEMVSMLARNIDSFSNPDGFQFLFDRLETAYKTPASMYESNVLFEILSNVRTTSGLRTPSDRGRIGDLADSLPARKLTGETIGSPASSIITRGFVALTGDMATAYGMTSADEISTKRQRMIPVQCSVGDLVNFASEVSTHWIDENNPWAKAKVDSLFGNLVSQEYDLEGVERTDEGRPQFHIDETRLLN